MINKELLEQMNPTDNQVPIFMVETPVLFITFARPEYARRTFNAIKKARPRKLYFYSDKAREDRPDEILRNNQIREYINEVDWDCDLKLYFREKHSGDIDTSLWGAYDWIFENEEQAILLEEDCLPSLPFFDFCDQLLPLYKDDKRIWLISGNNFIEGYNPNGYDYFFNYFPYMYGWASWRDRWQKINRGPLPYEKIKEYRLFDQIYTNRKASSEALKFTRKIINTPAWDYRFTMTMKCNGGFDIIPKINLVSNIGLTGEHNKGNPSTFHNRELPDFEKYNISNPPPFVVPDYGYTQEWYDLYYLKRRTLLYKIKSRIIKLYYKYLG